MQSRQSRHRAPATQIGRFAGMHFLETQKRITPIGNRREVRPDEPIKNMRAQDAQGFWRAMHNDGHGTRFPHRIDQQGNHRDVVKMGVRDEYVINAQQPASIKTSSSTSRAVVRWCRPPIPPLQPRTRTFILFPWNSETVAAGRSVQAPANNQKTVLQDTTQPVHPQPEISRSPPRQCPCRQYYATICEKNSILTPAISMMS